MNSEELEQSLRTEFEEHLKKVFADVQREISGLQEQIEQEFERHQSQLSEAFESFSLRAKSEKELDAGFRESVVEHLRLARDEGARITATAIAEAEAMEQEAAEQTAVSAAAPVASSAAVSQMRDAVNDICSQNSQAAILKSLVSHAGQFTPRGAFFIVKNEHLVGWRVFGRDEQQAEADASVREIFFPVSNKTTLGESLKSLSAVESAYGEYAGDSIFLDKLEFGEPEKMVSIPLVARGRAVAVLYADKGANGEEIDVEVLETLVRVAGLTVEVLAAAPTYAKQTATEKSAPVETREEDFQYVAGDRQPSESETATDDYAQAVESEASYQPESRDSDYSGEMNYQPEAVQSDATSNDYSPAEYSVEESVETGFEMPTRQAEEFQPEYQAEQSNTENYSWNQPAETTVEEPSAETVEPESVYAETDNYSDADAGGQYQLEPAAPAVEPFQNFDSAQYDAPESQNNGATANANDDSFNASFAENAAETAPAPTKPARSRFSDRNIDLPVEVSEDERRLHNDARRFARLLVSEIKLYNEQKVKEGRDGSDLYERLREAIDRSREMYDKRVQPPVAAKFDYFHYELVNSLAEGDEARLGESYAGAVV